MIACNTRDCINSCSQVSGNCKARNAIVENGKCVSYEPKPKEIEKIDYQFRVPIPKGYIEIITKLNELIDAVNELRRRE